MDVDITKIEENIKAIEAKSDRHYFNMFQKASNGKIILKDDLDSYETLLQNLAVAQKYVEYRRENEAIINGYLRLQEQINTLNIPNAKEDDKTYLEENVVDSSMKIDSEEGKLDKVSQTSEVITDEEKIDAPGVSPEEPVLEKPVVTKSPENIDEKFEDNLKDVSQTPEVVTDEEKMDAPEESVLGSSVVTESPEKVEERVESDLEAVVQTPEVINVEEKNDQDVPNVTDSISSLGVLADNFADDEYAYRLQKGEIIQDMAINDKSEQVFQTPGMSDEEIKTSQELINTVGLQQIPIADESAYKAMNEEEIQKSQEKLESIPVATDSYTLSSEEVNNIEPEVLGAKHKITKHENYEWKNRISKKFSFLKGLVFAESNRSREYLEISAKIANFRAKYKSKTIAENNAEIRQIEEKIINATGLAEGEEKKLYEKLSRLAKKHERIIHQNQEQLMQDADRLFEVEPASVLG